MKKFSFAIIGAGPSGFYIAKLLSKLKIQPIVHLYQKQICPFGLIRYGVAPDHVAIKNIQHTLSQVSKYKYFQYSGKKQINQKQIEELSNKYSGIIFANGAMNDYKLGYQDMTARKLVYWYNSHPDAESINLKGIKRVSIIGNGNVAIDMARILLKDTDQLKKTDISQAALQQLNNSNIQQVQIIGRRGITQSAFSLKQIRELKKYNIEMCAYKDELIKSLNKSSQIQSTDIGNNSTNIIRMNKRKLQFINSNFNLLDNQHSKKDKTKKQIIFRFLLNPLKYQKGQVIFNKNILVGQPFHQTVINTDFQTSIQTDLLISSIGFKGKPISQKLFNNKQNIVQNSNGCVIQNNQIKIGYYVVGWAKTGATGVIDSTLLGSEQTFNNIRIHIQNKILQQKQYPKMDSQVNFEDYERIRDEQIRLGKQKGKDRVKLNQEQMRKLL